MCQRACILKTTILDEALYLNRFGDKKKFPVPFNIVLRTCEICKENETLKVNAETLEKLIKESLIGLLISE